MISLWYQPCLVELLQQEKCDLLQQLQDGQLAMARHTQKADRISIAEVDRQIRDLDDELKKAKTQIREKEADECAAQRSQSDTKPEIHSLVVSNNKPCQCVRWVPSSVGLNRDLHAWKNPHVENFTDSNFPCSSLAENPRVNCHGPLPSVRSGARLTLGRKCPKRDDSPSKVLQDELELC